MQTSFSDKQLKDPNIRTADGILRACVHCGFCTATCPTYVLLGDELDSPRGRIYLIKDMLENDRPADSKTVLHVDRCLSCLACMTTCPSGVHYMHLVDHARAWIERTYRRPVVERALRWLLAFLLPHPGRFRIALGLGRFARPLAEIFPRPLGTMLRLVPRRRETKSVADQPGTQPAEGKQKMRVALLSGCVQQVLNPRINEATIRLLTRLGAEVVVAEKTGCCGALAHHLGKENPAKDAARANVLAWRRVHNEAPLDAIVSNASGCGTMLKDYGHLFEDDPLAENAAWAAGLARDVSEVIAELGLKEARGAHEGMAVAYHSACSLQHGQKITELPARLLREAGFEVRGIPEGHLCCGSAGTYNLLQPEIATRLLERKVACIEQTGAMVVAAGNIGCMTQIADAAKIPVAHTAELLDWATGGPKPPFAEVSKMSLRTGT